MVSRSAINPPNQLQTQILHLTPSLYTAETKWLQLGLGLSPDSGL